MKRKPRPAKACFVTVYAEHDGVFVRIGKNSEDSASYQKLTPAEAKRIGRKLLELAEYLEEKGE